MVGTSNNSLYDFVNDIYITINKFETILIIVDLNNEVGETPAVAKLQ